MLKVYYAGFALVRQSGDYPISEYRRSRLVRIKPPHARRASLGAELLLCRALGECCPDMTLPPDIIQGEHGKPYLRGGEAYFSLSHSGERVAAAICDREVGLDIQEMREYNPKLAERFFAPDERLYVENSTDKSAAFTELWSKKESYIKAIGTGLSTPLNSFSVMNMPGLFYTTLDEFALSVCVPECAVPAVDLIKKVVFD